MNKHPLTLLLAVASGLATSITTHAAIITWGAATNITPTATGELSDVSTNGSLIGAFNVGDTGVAAATLNGVNFQSFAVPNGSAGATVGNFTIATAPAGANNIGFGLGAAPFSTLSSAYQTFLASGLHQGFGFTLTISGLNVGTQYEFQWWANSSNAGQATSSATAGNTVTLLTRNPEGPGSVGQFALGTFTANSATQSVAFGGSLPTLNGFQVRQVPEPSTWALLGLGLPALLASRRRNRKA